MLDQLEVGMTQRQVAYVLGNPLIKDTFNPNRWDYLYQLERGDEVLNRYHIAVYFKDGLYTHFDGTLPKDTNEVIDPEKGKKLEDKARDHN
jgi:outer membrane protein assembly factor BamE